jgi:hypothetical protein
MHHKMDTDIEDSFNVLLGRKYGKYMNLAAYKQGGYYQYEEEFYQSILDICTGLVEVNLRRYINPPTIHVAFLENSNLGAVVIFDQQTNAYFIGLYFGSIIVLRAFFSTILTSPKVLTWLGDVKKEKSAKIEDILLTNINAIGEFLDTYPNERVRPNEEVRRDAVEQMTHYAMQFLVMHELGHIVRGHIAYRIANSKGSNTNSMYVDSTDEELMPQRQTNIEAQALECDADAFAAFHGVATSYQIVGADNEIAKRQALDLWLMSMYGLFILLASKRLDISNPMQYEHPPAKLRLSMALFPVMDQMHTISEKLFGKKTTKDEIVMVVGAATIQVEVGIIDTAKHRKSTFTNDLFMQGPVLEAHRNRIMEAMNILWTEVRKFKLEFVNP